eukprot:GGOE01009142.1.p5 GENE.GGOE01009142.1~~GGOE01009142.1.p5  ORF type:complete len:112 (-),score=3.68 GGOE01009142.1:607-942(-)
MDCEQLWQCSTQGSNRGGEGEADHDVGQPQSSKVRGERREHEEEEGWNDSRSQAPRTPLLATVTFDSRPSGQWQGDGSLQVSWDTHRLSRRGQPETDGKRRAQSSSCGRGE